MRLTYLRGAAFFFAYLAIQVTVPLVQLTRPRMARFGWQMYSAAPNPPRYTLILADGSERPVNFENDIGHGRGDVDYVRSVPRSLCRLYADAVFVRFEGVSVRGEFRCGR